MCRSVSAVILFAAMGCGGSDADVGQLRPDVETPKQSVSDGNEKLANRIKPLSEEEAEDPSLKVTATNAAAIDLIRSLTIMRGIQFDEATLGYCDERESVVVFKRPEAKYGLTYTQGTEFRSVVVTAWVETDQIKPEKVATVKRMLLEFAMIAGLSGDSSKISTQSESNCQQLKSVLYSKDFEKLLDSAMQHSEVDAEFDCGILQMRFVNAPETLLRIEIQRK